MSDPVTSVFNDAYIAETFEHWLRDPSSVEESWRQFFELANRYGGASAPASVATPSPAPVAAPAPAAAPGAWSQVPALPVPLAAPAAGTGGFAPGTESPSAAESQDFARRVVGISRYLNAIRRYGFLAVQLDPLGAPPPGAVELHIAEYGITEADLDLVSGDALGFPHLKTARDVADRLKYRYTRNIAVEFVHCGTDEERQWFRQLFTAEQLTRALTPDEKRALLTRLSQVEGLERFLGRAFVGYKRFSIEGTDALVPMLDAAIAESAAAGARHVAISMAHRGRLNVLTNVMGKPFADLFAEFEGRHDHLGGAATGDVKYHLGYAHEVSVGSRAVQMTLVPNPSHLEIVNPVLQGVTRALQRNATDPYERDEFAVVPVCIHGDAAFPGEGIVAETFNLAHLRGYTVGGTLHIIVNNQVGFTTDPSDARTTRFASDLAKGFEMPIIHVNADDPEACVIAMRIAVAYRTTFGRDFVVDLVGYRRHGHNEGDEPAYTQPLVYDRIRSHPTVRQLWGRRLVQEGLVTEADVDAAEKAVSAELQRIHDATKGSGSAASHDAEDVAEPFQPPVTSVQADLLHTVNDALLTWPDTFTPHPRLAKQLERRREVMDAVGGIDWGHAEALAFATILADGTSIRLTGQDAERGTFSHRHAVLHDVKTGQTWTPLQHIAGTASAFEIYNSPLSELAVMGFEYGFSVTAPDALTLWEA
ncbi:MAG TPA: thiamine pyrophosphate-dependent enzyme, partial [Gemmatimonadaceae bacterium]|nr:thiamine pyrophosphate-dependent enzyme [Gemmatimonadaceae bacterium]